MIASLKKSLFCFSGTLDRESYWWRTLGAVVLFIVLMKAFPFVINLFFLAIGKSSPILSAAPGIQIGRVTLQQSWGFFFLALPLAALLLWSLLSISARRLRDAGWSVWWLIPFLIAPILLHLAYWIFYLHHPFSLPGSANHFIRQGDWFRAPEFMFPRAFIPIWSLIELNGVRFHEIYQQAVKELVVWPARFSAEALANMGVASFWRQHLGILVPAFCLSAWGTFVLGVRPSRACK